MMERAIQSLSGQVRVLLSTLEERWGRAIPCDHPMMCYIVEYASILLNRFEVEVDGKTACRRKQGKDGDHSCHRHR